MSAMRAPDMVLRARRGYDGWFIVGIVFLSAGLTIGTSNYAFGLFVEPLERSFEWQRTAISASLSFMAISSLSSPFIGRIMDAHGARPVMVAGLAVFGLSFALRPFMTELWHLYVLSLMQFVGFSGVTVLPAGRLVPIWFPNSRGRAMGFAMMGNNFGGLTVPLVVGFVLGVASWQVAFAVIAAIAFALAALAATLVHEAPPYVAQGPGQARPAPILTGSTVRQALGTRNFYAMTLAITLASFTYSGVLPHVNAHLTDVELPRTVVLTAVGLLATFGMMGKLGLGYLAERITARRAMMLSLAGQALFILLLVRYPSQPLVWMSVPLYGFCMGAYGVVATLLVQETFGVKYFGSISGLANVATVVPLVAGPLLAGASADITGSYGTAFTIVAGMFGLGVVALTQVRTGDEVEPTLDLGLGEHG